MIKLAEIARLEERFLRYISDLKSSQPLKRKGVQKRNLNLKLRTAASRITLPSRFEPYVNIINRRNSINFKFPDKPTLTIDEVKSSDRKIIENYKKRSFDWSRLNRDTLIRASQIASIEMGLHKKFLVTTPTQFGPSRFPQTSSACYPTYQKKSNPEAQQMAIDFANGILQDSDKESKIDKLLSEPTTLFHRFQFKIKDNKVETKIRPIWGIPFGVSVLENYFFRDWVDSLSVENKIYGKTYTPLGLNLTEISSNIIAKFRLPKDGLLLSMDLKSFDSSIPAYLWALFISNVVENMDKSRTSDITTLEALMQYYVYTPFCYFSTEVEFQRGGTPSGCLITAAFNSWVNRTVFNYAHLERELKPPGEDLCVLGDDNLYLMRRITPAYIYNVYERFGMEVNKDKTDIFTTREDISFLGYLWNMRNQPYQKESWYITHLCMPSSFYKDVGVPIGLYMTYRAMSVCLPLANGFAMFRRLIGNEDKYFNLLYDKYKRGEDTSIEYVTNDSRYKNIYFPFSLFIKGSWDERANASIGKISL